MRDDHSADADAPESQPLAPDAAAPAIGLRYLAAFCAVGLLVVAGVVGRAGLLGR